TASAIAGWVNASLLLGVLIRRGQWGRDVGLMTRIPRLLVAAALMGGFLHFAIRWFADALASASPLYTQAATLAALSAVAAVIYFAVAFAIGGADFGMIRRSVRRGAARPDPDLPASD
ncbi:MAG: lipid II flippase MurJ, partial [Mesorhizobium sp.]